MNTYQRVIQVFNSKKSNKIFTRSEYFLYMKLTHPKAKITYLDTLRCYLVRAGYLRDEEPGLYRKMKPIPEGITQTQFRQEAYPESTVSSK